MRRWIRPAAVVALVHLIAYDITEDAAYRSADQCSFGISADCLSDQGATAGSKEQAIDPVILCQGMP
jgi:hypothetical protein